MDSQRFDDITRFFSGKTSRRGTIAALVGGIGTSLAAPRIDLGAAARKGKKKRKKKTCRCDICRRCQGRRCVPAPDGTACGECGMCDAGFCVPKVNQTLCDLCTTCQAGMCVNRPVGTPCGPNAQCDGGECRYPPNCDQFSTACTSGATCCSEACCQVLGVQYCCRSELGSTCLSTADCVEGALCVAFSCRSQA